MKRESKFNKSDDGEEEDEASWQDSYSDLMTDLLAIFVILFSFAMMSQAISNANSAAGQSKSVIPKSALQHILPSADTIGPGGEVMAEEQDDINSILEAIQAYVEEQGLSDKISVTDSGDNKILLRVASSLLFESGRADINSNADPMLGKLSEILTTYEEAIKMVRIEGHTDNIPINNSHFNSNWELSTSRAVNVLRRFLETSQLEPEKLSAVGYSEFHPIVDNNTEAGRARNRRVDFIIETVNE